MVKGKWRCLFPFAIYHLPFSIRYFFPLAFAIAPSRLRGLFSPEKFQRASTSPVCPPRYAPGKVSAVKCLRATVDNAPCTSRFSFVFRGSARIFRPRRRTRKWPAELENGSQNGVRRPNRAKTLRSNRKRAGRTSAASDRGVIPERVPEREFSEATRN
jgi:hypothetical protein